MASHFFVLAVLLATTAADLQPKPVDGEATIAFDAPKYGVSTKLPKDWPIAVREKEDRVFVALIAQDDPDRPGVAACELGLAPENLGEYQSRIDGTAKRGGRPGGTLAGNRIIKNEQGERLETIWEFRPRDGQLWIELSVRLIVNRQIYTFILNASEGTFRRVRPAFDALVASSRFTPPNSGADLLAKATNRWVQREYKFSLDLPEEWSPVLAPSEVALLFANGPAKGIWSDNVLVIAHPKASQDLKELAKILPDRLKEEEPNCEIISCKVVPQGKEEALETVVRTQRGPFSMTVIERRLTGERFDYEVKYTIETKRFDAMVPKLRQSLDSFRELPGVVPGTTSKSA